MKAQKNSGWILDRARSLRFIRNLHGPLLFSLFLATALLLTVTSTAQDATGRSDASGATDTSSTRVVDADVTGETGVTGLPPADGLVLVMVDTLRADHLGAYGHSKPASPFLDRLSREGITLTRTFSHSPWTRPSMAGLLTSTHSGRHRVFREKWDPLPEDAVLLSEILQARGFTTIGLTANPIMNSVFGFNQGFHTYLDSKFIWSWMEGKNRKEESEIPARQTASKPWNAEQVSTLALDSLSKIPAGAPFFLQTVYLDVHTPRRPPPEYTWFMNDRRYKALYDASILYTDQQISRLYHGLKKMGRDNVWFVVFSDHGEGLNDNNGLVSNKGHGFDLYDTVIQVPVIIHHPKLSGQFAGLRLDAPLGTTDLVPTLLDLLGLPHHLPQFEGRSCVPLMVSPTGGTDGSEPIFSETEWRGVRRAAIRADGWKMILHEQIRPGYSIPGLKPGDVELYNLDRTGIEGASRHNAAAAHPERVRGLRKRLSAWRQINHPLARRPEEAQKSPDKETVEALKALGYVE